MSTQGLGAGRGGGRGGNPGGSSKGSGRGGKPGSSSKGSGCGGNPGGPSKGSGQGSKPGGSKEQQLKTNLQKTLKDAEKLIKELNLEKANKQHKDVLQKKDTRGSKSMINLKGSASTTDEQHSQTKGKGRTPNIPQKLSLGSGGKGGGFRHPSPQPSHPISQHKSSAQDHFVYTPPPPSYEESMRDRRQDTSSHVGSRSNSIPNSTTSQLQKPPSQTKLKADSLVKSLAIFRGQFESADTLGRQLTCEAMEVIKVAKSRKDLFSVLGEGNQAKIELVPKLCLCSDYLKDCCSSTSNCKQLHICKTYVTEFCDAGPACPYGHRWDTDHNDDILSKFYLDLIDKKTLHQIVRKLSRDKFRIGICTFYSLQQGCKYDTCRKLHICKSYIEGGGKCSVDGCNLNHNIIEKQCINLLKSQGVAVNEAPRDILSFVISTIRKQPGKDTSLATGTDQKSKDSSAQKKQEKENPASEDSSDDASDVDLSDDNKTKKSKGKKKSKKQKTCKSTDVLGEVEIPEICIYSIDDKCRNEKQGCKYLHAKSLFHWQFECDRKWYNFRIFQSKKLETAYRDVSIGNVEVPALNENKLHDYEKKLLDVLGTDTWKANFAKMTLTDGDKTVKLRRVSTQSSVRFNNSKATVFGWFFKDDQEKWIQFGQADNLTSADIEEQYLSHPSSSMLIYKNNEKYKIDFSRMVQVHVSTGKEWVVRRRPVGLTSQMSKVAEEAQKSKGAEEIQDPSMPPHWSPMSSKQTHVVVPLTSDSPEFTEVSGRLRLTLPTITIVSIKRLQNPYLWRLLQNKKEEFSQRYNENELNMQKLFHGIKSTDIETICKENIDWRQETTAQQDFGQGTYFSNSAAKERSRCIQDENGRSHVFLAHVIIGKVTKGESSFTRPPVNPQTGTPFETTVDDVEAPTVFVKYDKDEYYPEYVIEFY